MKVLNLFAGIGGNRKLWKDVDVTAVEIDEKVASEYSRLYPDDKVLVEDAHEYLKDNYHKFDFVWSSPPCQTHSKMARVNHKRYDLRNYPDMRLYQEIIFLDHFFDGKWVVENVNPYYETLIPAEKVGRHLVWANFKIGSYELENIPNFIDANYKDLSEWVGIKLEKKIYMNGNHSPAQVYRNCTHPEIGQYILERAKGIYRKSNEKQLELIQEQ